MKIKFNGNIPSLKNSKQIFKNSKTGKNFITSSEITKKYLAEYEYQWADKKLVKKFRTKIEKLKKPYKIGFYFIRSSKRKFDYINILQLPCDLMVKYGWIDDDNCDEIIPIILGYCINKEEAGIEIEILN